MRKQWLFLVGISEYADHRLASLPGVRRDIDLLCTCLEEYHAFPLGGRIEDWRDAAATHRNLLSTLGRVCEQAGPEDQILVFFAGHGTTVADGSAALAGSPGTTYFLPGDADLDALPDRGIRSEDIAARLRETRAQQVVLIFDFCNASGLTFDLPSLTSPQLDSRDWFVGTTCRSCQSVVDTPQGGFFVRCFCDALSGRVRQQRSHISVDVATAFLYASDRARASLAHAGFSQQPRAAQAGGAILLTTPPRALVRHSWRNVLLLEDDASYGRPMVRFLTENGYSVQWLQSVDELSLEKLAGLPPDLAVVDLWFGAEAKGLSAVRGLRRANPLLPILVVTAHLSSEYGLRVGKAGADDLLEKRLPPESEDFRDLLLARIGDLQRRQRDSDIPNLEKRLQRIDAGTLYDAILEPLYAKRGYTNLHCQDVPGPPGAALRVLSCLKDNGLGELEGFGIYAVLDDIAVGSVGPGSAVQAKVVIDQLKRICAQVFVDIPPQGRTRLYRVILHCTGVVSAGAKDLIESAPSLHHRAVVFDKADLIGMLRTEELDHRLAFSAPSKNVDLYLSAIPSTASDVCTWAEVFRILLQSIEKNHPLDAQRCLQRILARERVACGAGPSAVGTCHIYEPRLPTNLLFVTLASRAFPWSQTCRNASTLHGVPPCRANWSPGCGDVRLAFLSIFAGDEAQEHAIQLRRIMQALATDYYRRPSHLEQEDETTLGHVQAWLHRCLTAEGFTLRIFRDVAGGLLNRERRP
jgi:ActR/RegA family two-component response regulator